jgi:hypothetical protein
MKIPAVIHQILIEAILLFLSPTFLSSQITFNGRITDTVKCSGQPGQTYSLYVPSTYTGKSKWPVILLFDPGGRGTIAVKAFRPASEKYGYILACSHNSRNGPLADNFTAAGSVLTDLTGRFSLDNKRIYTAGFSGGSRFALALASTNSFITGVIGCGAGLPGDQNLVPSKASSFVYYGIAGTMDMNWLEMSELMTFFNNNTSVIPYLRIFDGGHQWPPADILNEAVEWINLQAMKKKIMPVDPDFISSYSGNIKTLVRNLTGSGNYYDAVRYLEFAVRDFSGEPLVAEMKQMLTSAKQSKEYRESSLELSGIVSREKSLTGKYISSIQNILYSGAVADTTAYRWKKEIGSLIIMREKGSATNRQFASRLLNFISILCSEQGTSQFRQKRYSMSEFLFGLCTLSDSGNPENYYNLARSLSVSDRKKDAIEELNKAILHGFTSKKLIENEAAFNNIRNEEGYKLLIRGMK